MSFVEAKNYLESKGYGDRIKEFDVSSATVELAALAVGTEPEKIAKSLTFMVEEKPVMIICAGDAKVDNGKYKACFHKKAKMLTREEVHTLIGHDVGGVCPFGINEGVDVYLDDYGLGLEFSPAYERLQGELAELFMKFKYLLNSDKVNPEDKQIALRIPNAEVMDIFRKSVVEWFTKKRVNSDRRGLFDSLWSGDTEKLTELLSDLLFDTISYHDYAESFYHAFLTGLVTSGGYIVESNYENGLGRSDLVIKDRRNRRAVVIEAKIASSEDVLEKECQTALRQIEDNQYARKLNGEDIRK